MADLQATSELIKWTVNGLTVLLMIIAASMAIKKKNNIALGVAIVGNLAAFYLTQSPLLCMIISIACIIWASKSKEAGQAENRPKTKKIGNVIGLILGIGFVAGPLIGYLRQEASLSDPTTQGVLILFAVIGGFMIINNLFKLFETDASAPAPSRPSKPAAKAETEDEGKVRCRFCKKLYSSDYNGCPHCKKK